MGRLKQEAKDAYKTKRRNYNIPELERRARSQGVDRNYVADPASAIQRNYDYWRLNGAKRAFWNDGGRPYWTGEPGSGVHRRGFVDGPNIPVAGFEEKNKREAYLRLLERAAMLR